MNDNEKYQELLNALLIKYGIEPDEDWTNNIVWKSLIDSKLDTKQRNQFYNEFAKLELKYKGMTYNSAKVSTQEDITVDKTKKVKTEEEFKQCPFCAEDIKYAAMKCEHCGDEFYDETEKVKLEEKPIADAKKEDKEVEISDEIQTNDNEEYSLKKCPYCQEEIHIDAIKCKHCGEEVGKGYEINEDGTCVANKIQGERTSVQSEVLVHHNRPMSGGQVFFRVVWITLLVIFIWVVVQLGACVALLESIG